jgi:AAA+ ATPase superfamily predicted ATPase
MFVGRKDQLEQLGRLWRKPKASLVTCRGRRRIGKSTMVEEFARRSGARLMRFEGLAPRKGMNNEQQLAAFASQLALQFREPECRFHHWAEAFATLAGKIDGRRRTVVLLDEISWMGRYDPDFAGYLKVAWDQAFHPMANLVFVLCGSVSAWIADNILKNTGFVGRDSLDIVLPELSLPECRAFWGKADSRVPAREKFDLLSITGGVPKYLEDIDPSLSADENIRQLCFLPEGPLFRDFDETFSDVFGPSAVEKRNILRALSDGSLTAAELARKADCEANGHLSAALDELVLAGFAEKDEGVNPETGKPSGRPLYRLRDNYARFHLRYVEPHAAAIRKGSFRFASLDQLPGWDSILGLQFENLILGNVRDLIPRLGFGNTLVRSAAPWRNSRKSAGRAVQIDQLLQTTRSVCLVEIKRRREIGREVIDEMEAKVKALRVAGGKAVRTALVYEGRLHPGVEADGYFDRVIPAETLFGEA